MSKTNKPTKEERDAQVQNNPRLRHFVESGDADTASRLISMAYLLFSIAEQYTEEANELIRKHGLYHFNLKYLGNNLIRSFDMYDRQLRTMIVDEEAKTQPCKDYDIFEQVCRRYMNSKETSEP